MVFVRTFVHIQPPTTAGPLTTVNTSKKSITTLLAVITSILSTFNGFEPAQMKPDLNWSQLDEEFEETNELDKCFYEPASIIHIELSYKSSVS